MELSKEVVMQGEVQLEPLIHVGFVNQDEIYQQENALRVVRLAMDRAALGLDSSITWLPTNFQMKRDQPKRFRKKISEGVQSIIAELLDGDTSDAECFYVLVKYLRRRGQFQVRIIKFPDAYDC